MTVVFKISNNVYKMFLIKEKYHAKRQHSSQNNIIGKLCVCVSYFFILYIKGLFCEVCARTYHRLLFPHLNVLSLRFGEMIPNLLVAGGNEQSLNLTD